MDAQENTAHENMKAFLQKKKSVVKLVVPIKTRTSFKTSTCKRSDATLIIDTVNEQKRVMLRVGCQSSKNTHVQ
jgi:hypothetical protein